MGEFTLNEVDQVEGIVSESSGDTLFLVARWLHPRVGRKYDALFATYNIPSSGMQRLETWQFAPKRTAIFLGVFAASSVFLIDVVSRATGGGGFLPIGGGAETSVVAPR